MSLKLTMQSIIEHNIYIERNIIDWNEYKSNIIKNLSNINFKEKINDYIKPEGRKLYLSKPKLRTILHNIVVINSKIFIEKGYDNYEPRNNYNITFIDICNFIEECVIILVNKQKQLI